MQPEYWCNKTIFSEKQADVLTSKVTTMYCYYAMLENIGEFCKTRHDNTQTKTIHYNIWQVCDLFQQCLPENLLCYCRMLCFAERESDCLLWMQVTIIVFSKTEYYYSYYQDSREEIGWFRCYKIFYKHKICYIMRL